MVLKKQQQKILHRFKAYMEQSFENGVNLSHIPLLETCFSTAINVYNLKEDKSVEVIYLSRLSFPGQKTMHLNLYKNHFSYISKISSYAKKYQCNMCDRIFDRADSLKAHVNTCSTEIEEIYVGGKFKPKETVFD